MTCAKTVAYDIRGLKLYLANLLLSPFCCKQKPSLCCIVTASTDDWSFEQSHFLKPIITAAGLA